MRASTKSCKLAACDPVRTKNSTPINSHLQIPFSSTLSPDPVAPYRLYFSVLHVFYMYMYT